MDLVDHERFPHQPQQAQAAIADGHGRHHRLIDGADRAFCEHGAPQGTQPVAGVLFILHIRARLPFVLAGEPCHAVHQPRAAQTQRGEHIVDASKHLIAGRRRGKRKVYALFPPQRAAARRLKRPGLRFALAHGRFNDGQTRRRIGKAQYSRLHGAQRGFRKCRPHLPVFVDLWEFLRRRQAVAADRIPGDLHRRGDIGGIVQGLIQMRKRLRGRDPVREDDHGQKRHHRGVAVLAHIHLFKRRVKYFDDRPMQLVAHRLPALFFPLGRACVAGSALMVQPDRAGENARHQRRDAKFLPQRLIAVRAIALVAKTLRLIEHGDHALPRKGSGQRRVFLLEGGRRFSRIVEGAKIGDQRFCFLRGKRKKLRDPPQSARKALLLNELGRAQAGIQHMMPQALYGSGLRPKASGQYSRSFHRASGKQEFVPLYVQSQFLSIQLRNLLFL